MQDSDENLIKNYLEGQEEAFKSLIDKYSLSIFNYSARFSGKENANDITQEVFIKTWKNIKKFDYKKAQFKTWLWTIARNTIFDFLKKKKIINFSDLDFSNELDIPDESLLPNEVLEKEYNESIVNKALDELPVGYKEVLILYYSEDLTFKEIGDILKKPLNTVKNIHFRAIKILKDKLHQIS